MRKKIAILTGTRAEYGLLKPLIYKMKSLKEFDVKILVTGAHLSPEFGLTYKEIEKDGIFIDEKIEILLSGDTPSSISKSMALALCGFSDCFSKIKPDGLIVLGDRYETLSVAIAAMNQNIPIIHLHGGETTEGAIDECIRHAITKMSHLHFTSTEIYRRRVIQLGEQPESVFNVGALGVENILNETFLSKKELEEELDFSLKWPYAVVTFHPVTLEGDRSRDQINSLLQACNQFKDMGFIFTKSNADAYGRIINSTIDEYVKNTKNMKAFFSLGIQKYLSALKFSSMVIGNSSSGLIEAPSFGVPTVNIGDRQKGRLQASSVINCRAERKEIEKAIVMARSKKFKEEAKKAVNPYGDGYTSSKIVNTIQKYISENKFLLKKTFYDL